MTKNLHNLPPILLTGEGLYGIYREQVTNHLAVNKGVPLYKPIRPPYWLELEEAERQRWERVAKWVLGHTYEVTPLTTMIKRAHDNGIADYE